MRCELQGIGLVATVLMSATSASAQTRSDVNFAFGGATTGSASAMDAFATQVPALGDQLAAIREHGLDVVGLTQQLDFATATLNDIDPVTDAFWLYAGINNYLAGSQDPSVAPADVRAALERLYCELGARRFVVPNLPAIGDLPLFASMPREVQAALTSLTVFHNQLLAGVLAGFEASHPDADVIPLDVFSIFQDHKRSGQFAHTEQSCDMAVPADQLAVPGVCDGFLYLDTVHPVSAAWGPVAQAAADALAGNDVTRLVTLGDSFSDLGAMSDTFLRGVGVTFPSAPSTAGRFTEGDNVIEQLEDLLATPVRVSAFLQPFTAQQTLTDSGAASVRGSVFVPKTLAGEGRDGSSVKIRFNGTDSAKITCQYKYAGTSTYVLHKCRGRHVQGGGRLTATSIDVKLQRHSPSISIDWLYYQ